ARLAFRVIRPDELEWKTRPHEPEEAPRHVAELSELAGFEHSRANVWRYPRRARHSAPDGEPRRRGSPRVRLRHPARARARRDPRLRRPAVKLRADRGGSAAGTRSGADSKIDRRSIDHGYEHSVRSVASRMAASLCACHH